MEQMYHAMVLVQEVCPCERERVCLIGFACEAFPVPDYFNIWLKSFLTYTTIFSYVNVICSELLLNKCVFEGRIIVKVARIRGSLTVLRVPALRIVSVLWLQTNHH